MNKGTINISEEQFAKLVQAYKTLQEFFTSALLPNELYREEFIEGLKESDSDIENGRTKRINSFDDFTE